MTEESWVVSQWYQLFWRSKWEGLVFLSFRQEKCKSYASFASFPILTFIWLTVYLFGWFVCFVCFLSD